MSDDEDFFTHVLLATAAIGSKIADDRLAELDPKRPHPHDRTALHDHLRKSIRETEAGWRQELDQNDQQRLNRVLAHSARGLHLYELGVMPAPAEVRHIDIGQDVLPKTFGFESLKRLPGRYIGPGVFGYTFFPPKNARLTDGSPVDSKGFSAWYFVFYDALEAIVTIQIQPK